MCAMGPCWVPPPCGNCTSNAAGLAARQALVQQHTGDARWGAHAQRIASGEMWHPPRPGGNNDQAHPPIHPTRYTRGEASWPQEKARQPCIPEELCMQV